MHQIVRRARRTHANVYSPMSGRYYFAKNLLFRDSTSTIHRQSLYPSYYTITPSTVGYYLIGKMAKSVYGYVYKVIIVKRRRINIGEAVIIRL